ncbi:MAG: copper resistance protein B [Acidobacteriaceae bacterium]
MNRVKRVGLRAWMAAAVLCLPVAVWGQMSKQGQAGVKVTSAMPGMKMTDMGHQIFAHALLDQFEGRTNGPDQEFRWDGEGWTGGDLNKLWIKSEGVVSDGVMSDGDQEFLYDRAIPRLRYFDAQVGVREDLDSGPARTWAAIGMEGMAPYFFEFAPTLYIGKGGDIGGRINASYELMFTQRLIAEPQAELNFYSQDDRARGTGAGLSEVDTGVRLRYEFSRKFAPYVGFAYNGKYGDAAKFARADGERVSDPRFVFGVRAWF